MLKTYLTARGFRTILTKQIFSVDVSFESIGKFSTFFLTNKFPFKAFKLIHSAAIHSDPHIKVPFN